MEYRSIREEGKVSIPLAAVLPYCQQRLELRGRRHVRLSDQPTDHQLLRTRDLPDGEPRSHGRCSGVYGMLAIALILFSWRGLVENKYWSESRPDGQLLGSQRRLV